MSFLSAEKMAKITENSDCFSLAVRKKLAEIAENCDNKIDPPEEAAKAETKGAITPCK
jgi:hypothetical protein